MLTFDQRFEIIVAAHRDAILTHLFTVLSALGDARVITVVAVSLLLVLWRHKQYAYKIGFLVALFGTLATNELLKLAVHRPRPLPPIELIHQSGYSFPSAHAAVSMATYGFLIYAVVRLARPARLRAAAITLLAALIFLIGFSRIYLGVHYLTDVIGGFGVGALFIYLGIHVTRSLSARRDRGASRGGPSGR